jgi:hypothetical protein
MARMMETKTINLHLKTASFTHLAHLAAPAWVLRTLV